MRETLVLLTNDDGWRAEGLQALRHALARIGRVIVVAPATEMSATSHAITLTRPLSCQPVDEDVHAVDGTPTDCVNVAVHGLLPRRPDVVVSGINHGANLGDDVAYSGTVAAAHEGALMGLPSLAASMVRGAPSADFGAAAEVVARVADSLARGALALPAGTFLNLNAPAGAPSGLSVTRLARRTYVQPVAEHSGEAGRAYYWMGGHPTWESRPGTDHHAVVSMRHVSVSLLGTDWSASVPAGSDAGLAAALAGAGIAAGKGAP